MGRLPAISGNDTRAIRDTLTEWQKILEPHLPNDAEPVVPPRNVRCSAPSSGTIRVSWDTGSLNTEGYDVSISETADFTQSQSRRAAGAKAGYLDLTVGDAEPRYFRVRAYKGPTLSGWSNIAKGVGGPGTAASTGTGGGPTGVPAEVLFNVRRQGQLEDYGHLTIEDIRVKDNIGVEFLEHIEFFAPSIDETDIGLYGIGSINASTNPVKFTPSAVLHGSRLGRDFAPGDFIQWTFKDPGDNTREINQILDIQAVEDPDNPGFFISVWTLLRHVDGDTFGTAMFGSTMVAHDNDTFYRLIPQHFKVPYRKDGWQMQNPLTPSGIDTTQRFSWCAMSVAAVLSQGYGSGGFGPIHVLNLAPNTTFPPLPSRPEEDIFYDAPGLRTLTGAGYTNLGRDGTLAVLQRERFPVHMQNWHSLRCLYCSVNFAPIGAAAFAGLKATVSAALVIYVLYVAPAITGSNDDRVVGLIEQLNISSDRFESFPFNSRPDGRPMPYQRLWPTTRIDRLNFSLGELNAIAAIGDLSISGTMDMVPDGDFRFIVAAVGTDFPGADVIVTIQK